MLYNYKSKNAVQDVILECLCKLTADIVDEYNNLRRDEMIYVYLPSYMASELVDMLLNEDIGLYITEDAHVDLLNKDDFDVLITIIGNGQLHIECARGYSDDFKDLEGCRFAYFYDGYSHKDLRKLTNLRNNIPVLVFGFEEECTECGDALNLDLIINDEDEVIGFQAYTETDSGFFGYEYYNTNDYLGEDEIYKILKTIGMI